jgi:hypothetical protein
MQASTPPRWWAARPGVGGLRLERGDDGVDLAGEELEGVAGDQGSAAGSAPWWKHQAARQGYSSPWTGVDQNLDGHAAAGDLGADQVELVGGARVAIRLRPCFSPLASRVW